MPPSIPDEDPNATPAVEPADTTETAPATTPEELGGSLNEGGSFEPDFGSILDGIQEKLPRNESGEFVAKSKAEPVKEGVKPEGEAEKTETTPEESKSLESVVSEKKAEVTPAAPATTDRDADLKELESKLDPHASPKTKSNFKAQAAKIVEARNQADKAAADAKAARDELESAKKAGMPKEIEEELKYLRDTVRELDIARDPAINTKYDKKIAGNEDAIVKILKDNGYHLDKDGKEIPGRLDEVKKAGLNRRNLESSIVALEKAGLHEAADEMKDLLRQNYNLAKDREREVGETKTTFDQRKQAEAAEQTKQLESANQRMVSEFKAHVDKFPFLQPPPAVKPEDAPAIRKEKEKAISEFDARVMRMSEAVKKEAMSPTEAAITARVGILYRDHVLPHVQNQLAAAQKEVETLKARMKAMSGASLGDKSGTQKPAAAPRQEVDTVGQDFDSIIDGIAKSAGIR